VLVPASVQGPKAPAEIVAAIQYLCTLDDIDLMIVGRGGGSPEDLAPFNHEAVARAIFASTIPVISAVGHETDISIADFVADVRAATPSAAAEIALPDIVELQQEIADVRDALVELMEQHLTSQRSTLDQVQRRLWLQSPEARIARAGQALDTLDRRLRAATRVDLRQRADRLTATSRLLESLHPAHVLKRGFAFVEDPATNRPVRHIASLPHDGVVTVCFEDGRARGALTPISGNESSPERNEA
jgi:exodeoxyribonuclease VII large subunit